MEHCTSRPSVESLVAQRPHVQMFGTTPLPIDYALTFQLANLAAECYYVAGYDDPTFVAGIPKLEGARAVYTGRQAWLDDNGFTPIVNPDGNDPMSRYWGVCTVVNNVAIIALRGTNSLSDLKIDMGDWSVDLHGTYVKCDPWDVIYNGSTTTVLAHHMFLSTYLSIQANIRKWVQAQFQNGARPTDIWVVGHSLGGALANLCALDLAAFLGSAYPTPQLMTFGAPCVGDQAFATLLKQAVPKATRLALTWDVVTLNPNYGMWRQPPEYPLYVHAGTEVALTAPDWVQHFMQGYYWAIAATQPTTSSSGFNPLDPVESLVLQIKTSDSIGAGTDADISVNILGVDWGVLDLPWQTDFGRGANDTYDLFALFPDKVPARPTIHDIASITFTMGRVGYFDVYTYSWKLDHVDIRVNQRSFCTIKFNSWVGPGEESGSTVSRTIQPDQTAAYR